MQRDIYFSVMAGSSFLLSFQEYNIAYSGLLTIQSSLNRYSKLFGDGGMGDWQLMSKGSS